MDEVSLVKLVMGECHSTLLMSVTARQQAIAWAIVDEDLCRHLTSLAHNELNYQSLWQRPMRWWHHNQALWLWHMILLLTKKPAPWPVPVHHSLFNGCNAIQMFCNMSLGCYNRISCCCGRWAGHYWGEDICVHRTDLHCFQVKLCWGYRHKMNVCEENQLNYELLHPIP